MTAKVAPEDIVFNRESIAHARSQALIASWGLAADGEAGADLEDDEDDADNIQYNPEVGGVGAKIANMDEELGLSKSTTAKSRLLEQLVGKQAAQQLQRGSKGRPSSGPQHIPAKPLQQNTKKPSQPADDDSDDSDGRAAMIKSKPSRKRGHAETKGGSDDEGGRGSTKRKGGGGSYLDEVLSRGKKGKR